MVTPPLLRLDAETWAALVDLAGVDPAAFRCDVRTGYRLALEITDGPDPLLPISMTIGRHYTADGDDIPDAWYVTHIDSLTLSTWFVWDHVEIVGELDDPDGGEDPDHTHDLNR